jgi:hypothetical protein
MLIVKTMQWHSDILPQTTLLFLGWTVSVTELLTLKIVEETYSVFITIRFVTQSKVISVCLEEFIMDLARL